MSAARRAEVRGQVQHVGLSEAVVSPARTLDLAGFDRRLGGRRGGSRCSARADPRWLLIKRPDEYVAP